MKILVIIFAVLTLTGCSKTMALSTWNMGMANIAPGSYYTAYNSGREIILRIENVYNN